MLGWFSLNGLHPVRVVGEVRASFGVARTGPATRETAHGVLAAIRVGLAVDHADGGPRRPLEGALAHGGFEARTIRIFQARTPNTQLIHLPRCTFRTCATIPGLLFRFLRGLWCFLSRGLLGWLCHRRRGWLFGRSFLAFASHQGQGKNKQSHDGTHGVLLKVFGHVNGGTQGPQVALEPNPRI